MYWKYEVACKEAGMSEEEVKKIRRIFDDDRKRLKYKDRIMEEMQYTRISIDAEMDSEEREKLFEIPDPNTDVENEALWNLNLEKLQECLELLSPEEKDVLLIFYDKNVSISKYAKEKGVSRQSLYRVHDELFDRIKALMGV